MKKLLLPIALLSSITGTTLAQTAGTVDKTFTSSGYANLDFTGPNERASTLVLQPDGKIVIIGENVVSADATKDQVYIARIDAKGVKDATFGTGGVLKFDTGDKKEYGRDGLILSDGKFLVLSSSTIGTTNNMVVVRVTSAGALDATFGTSGKYTFDNKTNGVVARSMALQSDGKIVVGGESNGKFFVTRLTAAGAIDASFGANGVTTLSAVTAGSVNTSKLLIQKDGKIILVGYGTDGTGNTSLAVARFTNTGAVDATYGTAGLAEIDFSGNEFYYCAALQSDDKLVVGGKIAPLTAAKYETLAARLTTAGKADASFGTAGYYRGDLNAAQEEMRGMDIQKDGAIVMGGFIGDDIGSVRLTKVGALDLSYTSKGFVIIDVPNTTKDQANAVKIDNGGKILLGGVINFSSTAENFMVARIYSGLVSVFDTDNNKIPVNVFPNPTSNSFSMTYELSDATNVTFEMYDMTGKKVALLEKGTREAGKQQEVFEIPANIANGLYLCRMETKFGATNVQINVVR